MYQFKGNPENLIDGITNPSSPSQKWCNVSPDNWVIIDCQSLYRIYGFKIYDCKSGPENNENIRNYTIEVSEDCKNWTKVVDEKDKSSVNIKEDYIVPTMGRYIRFSLCQWHAARLGIRGLRYRQRKDDY